MEPALTIRAVAPKKGKKKSGPISGSKYIAREKKHAGLDKRPLSGIRPGQLFEDITSLDPDRKKQVWKSTVHHKKKSGKGLKRKPSLRSLQNPNREIDMSLAASKSQPCPTSCTAFYKTILEDWSRGEEKPPVSDCITTCGQTFTMLEPGRIEINKVKRKKCKKSKIPDEDITSVNSSQTMSPDVQSIAEMFSKPQPEGSDCAQLCCPPAIPNEKELIEKFVMEVMNEVEMAKEDMEDCLCSEVKRWMRYFMCSCSLDASDRAELAEAVAMADLNVPGLMDALIAEFRTQEALANQPPSGRTRISPDIERLRSQVAIRAKKSAKQLESARDRFKLAMALKVVEDVAAKEYEEIMRAQVDVMTDMLAKKIRRDQGKKPRVRLPEMSTKEMTTKFVGIPEY